MSLHQFGLVGGIGGGLCGVLSVPIISRFGWWALIPLAVATAIAATLATMFFCHFVPETQDGKPLA